VRLTYTERSKRRARQLWHQGRARAGGRATPCARPHRRGGARSPYAAPWRRPTATPPQQSWSRVVIGCRFCQYIGTGRQAWCTLGDARQGSAGAPQHAGLPGWPMPTHRPAWRRRWQGAEDSARSWPRSRAMRRRGSPGRTGTERSVVLLTDDTRAVHAVWWASRRAAGGVEVRADLQQGTCSAGTTCHRESCGRMTRAKARPAVRVLSSLPQACRTATTGSWASPAVPCGAALRPGGGRGWGSSAHQGCRETRQG
jgi:hypothetical protein